MNVQCYWMDRTERVKRYLRRYVNNGSKCEKGYGYHNGETFIEEADVIWYVFDNDKERTEYVSSPRVADWSKDDSRWPTKCNFCDYLFTPEDTYQVRDELIYVRPDTGERFTEEEAPPGAMWNAWWSQFKGPDGLSLYVKLPNGHQWNIDGPANNCTMPNDHRQLNHHCWVREGTPPLLTVGKNGVTCGAGAGSILSGNYHGFLRNGVLEQC